MTIKQIADRLAVVISEAYPLACNSQGCDDHGCKIAQRLTSILTDLRALDGKTVLPVEVVEYLTKTPYNKIVLTWHHGSFWAQTLLGPSAADELTCRPEPAAAIDALAEEIRKGKT